MKELQQAAKRLIDFGFAWDARNGFGAPVVLKRAEKKPRIYKTAITAAIHAGANDVLRRCESTGRYQWQAAA